MQKPNHNKTADDSANTKNSSIQNLIRLISTNAKYFEKLEEQCMADINEKTQDTDISDKEIDQLLNNLWQLAMKEGLIVEQSNIEKIIGENTSRKALIRVLFPNGTTNTEATDAEDRIGKEFTTIEARSPILSKEGIKEAKGKETRLKIIGRMLEYKAGRLDQAELEEAEELLERIDQYAETIGEFKERTDS